MTTLLFNKFKRIIKKPPHIILQRVWKELRIRSEKFTAPYKTKMWSLQKLLKENKAHSITELWQQLANQTFFNNIDSQEISHIPRENLMFIQQAAEYALQRKVDLLGTGLIQLDTPIDWHKDYKTNRRWPLIFFKNIDYNNLNEPSDVKIPWEISRIQWLLPLGQMYLITQEEKYAKAARDILLEWINNNPFACGVNWACTMEVAIRIIVWTWLFHAFRQSEAWSNSDFQARFLTALYIHADFTQKHLEKSSVNGNHYISDAAGLVFAGLFFSQSKRAQKWHELGWIILNKEIDLQISADGADYEGSIPYHRLVMEIFFFPALLRLRNGLSVSDNYRNHLLNMADFIGHYSRNNGSVPLLGDADDARILPFGEQNINDHRYLLGLISLAFDNLTLGSYFNGPGGEIFWWFGSTGIEKLNRISKKFPATKAFVDAGYLIMRNETDHIFIDCAPVGLKGNGGHGHNDCLSFEAVLDNELLIVDSGAYVYTASVAERNYFRSTAAHNTPMVAGAEINRFIAPSLLWTLRYDAKPHILAWYNDEERSIFRGSHKGYLKLKSPVMIERIICLNHRLHSLVIIDSIKSNAVQQIRVPFHFLPGITIKEVSNNLFYAHVNSKTFSVYFDSTASFSVSVEESKFSPSYGIKNKNMMLSVAAQTDPGAHRLITGIIPGSSALLCDEISWLKTNFLRAE